MNAPPIPRDAFAVTEELAYLDHAGVAPIPRSAGEAMRRGIDEAERLGSLARSGPEIERVRTSAAELCGVPASDLAFVKNTTEGLGFVANGLDWEPGDRVVVPDLEFPSTIYPWLTLEDRGVVVDRVGPVGRGRTLPLERFEEALREGPTRLVCVSWVSFGRGYRVDLEGLGRLCREHGALLCVDAIQGLGLIPASFDDWGVDFASADAHKWLCGPEGIGVFYVRGERRDLLRPLEPGWNAVVHRREWDNLDLVLDDTARRFEGGTPNVVGTYGLGGSLEVLGEAGAEAIWAHVDALCEHACDRLTDVGATVLTDRSEGASGIVTFTVDGQDPGDTAERLRAQGIVCAGPRGGGVRISPHGYNTAEDIDRLIEEIARASPCRPPGDVTD